MENKGTKEKTYLKEVVIGIVASIFAIALFVVCIILVNLYPIKELSTSWYLFLLLGLGIVFFLIGFIFLKKFNKKRLDYLLKRDKKEIDFEALIDKKKKEAEKMYHSSESEDIEKDKE